MQPITEFSGNSDQRAEALRLAKEAGMAVAPVGNGYWNNADQLVRLIALARASVAPQEPVAQEADKGPWTVHVDGRFLQSEDVTHDARLYINGDFFSDARRMSYAKALAAQLNAAPQPQAAPQEPVAQGTMCCPICLKDSPHTHDKSRWIGVDFDGTLAHDAYGRTDPYELGEPIMPMVYRIKDWLAKGFQVRILTARMCAYSHSARKHRDLAKMDDMLRRWTRQHIGVELPNTAEKDGAMEVLWDDRAVRVIRDTGHPQWTAATSDDVRDKRIAELEEHLTQAIMGRQFHYERAEKAEAALRTNSEK